MPIGFEYGNARIRARKAQLLGAADYDTLLGRDIDDLVAALAETAYRPDIETALPRYSGLRGLLEALRTNLARSLAIVATFYEGPPRAAVELMLRRWDVFNLRAVIRGHAARADPTTIGPLLVPAGTMDEIALAELAGQPDLRAAVDLLVAWRMPSHRVARAVAAAWSAYREHGDPAVLERALDSEYARDVTAALDEGIGGSILAEALIGEIDQMNVLGALRLWNSGQAGEGGWTGTAGDHHIPAGRVGLDVFEAATSQPSRPAAGEVLVPVLPHDWRLPIGQWVDDGDLAELTRRLEDLRIRRAVSLFHRGDPLSVAIPIAYIYAKENEVRNLRIIGQGTASGLPPERIRRRIMVEAA